MSNSCRKKPPPLKSSRKNPDPRNLSCWVQLEFGSEVPRECCSSFEGLGPSKELGRRGRVLSWEAIHSTSRNRSPALALVVERVKGAEVDRNGQRKGKFRVVTPDLGRADHQGSIHEDDPRIQAAVRLAAVDHENGPLNALPLGVEKLNRNAIGIRALGIPRKGYSPQSVKLKEREDGVSPDVVAVNILAVTAFLGMFVAVVKAIKNDSQRILLQMPDSIDAGRSGKARKVMREGKGEGSEDENESDQALFHPSPCLPFGQHFPNSLGWRTQRKSFFSLSACRTPPAPACRIGTRSSCSARRGVFQPLIWLFREFPRSRIP